MIVSCSLCGGENRVSPGQKMLFCTYCGSALALKKERLPEHLLLPHERSDREAEETLRSFLLSRGRACGDVEEIRFAYVPFILADENQGEMKLVPASTEPWAAISYPPSGNYRFYEESIADGEKI